VVAVTDASGSVLSQQRYLPFGGVRADVGNITQTDFGYTGQRALNNGLMDYHARFYDAALGRFVQPDTIIPDSVNPQTWNRYSYVSNDPITFNDPTGHRNCKEDGYNCPGDKLAGYKGKGKDSRLGVSNKSGIGDFLNTVADRYKLGWTNLGNSLSILKNKNSTLQQKALPFGYSVVWISAHVVLIAGLIVIGVDTSRDQTISDYPLSGEGSKGKYKSPYGSPDLSQPPGSDWRWRSEDPEANPPGSPDGAWNNPNTGEQLRNDPYEKSKGPHIDYTDPENRRYRIFPDESMDPKIK
jgi:RHS repeat-associated protein